MARSVQKTINDCITVFRENFEGLDSVRNNIATLIDKNARLRPFVHSIKSRIKDSDHLREKLWRKANECREKKQPFKITPDNVLDKVTDLAGVRILHLHTDQFPSIASGLSDLFYEYKYKVTEGPIAHIWDDEYKAFFKSQSIAVSSRQTLYTSVHYVVQANTRKRFKCEIQVRTLAEELWGEISHRINYPQATGSVACREQIMALARVTSSCTRLVDAIFRSYEDFTRSNPGIN